jgi:hypothetical protein
LDVSKKRLTIKYFILFIRYYQVKKVLDKPIEERSKDDIDLLGNCKDLVVHADLCRQNRILAAKQQEIVVDDAKTLELKCVELAEAIASSKCAIVYTGAGILFLY